MKTNLKPQVLASILAFAFFTTGAVSAPLTAQGQTFKVVYSLTGAVDGGNPDAGVVLDASGNLYGTTFGGGDAGCFFGSCGVLFELTPGSEVWSESVLYVFTGGSDGGNPYGGAIFDSKGNLYGITQVGGVSCGKTYGCGVVFELNPGTNGWTETVLHSFQGGADGYYPVAGLAFDKQGHLYSTTYAGGKYGQGSVYELSDGTGGWKEKTLYSFPGFPRGGAARGGSDPGCGRQSVWYNICGRDRQRHDIRIAPRKLERKNPLYLQPGRSRT